MDEQLTRNLARSRHIGAIVLCVFLSFASASLAVAQVFTDHLGFGGAFESRKDASSTPQSFGTASLDQTWRIDSNPATPDNHSDDSWLQSAVFSNNTIVARRPASGRPNSLATGRLSDTDKSHQTRSKKDNGVRTASGENKQSTFATAYIASAQDGGTESQPATPVNPNPTPSIPPPTAQTSESVAPQPATPPVAPTTQIAPAQTPPSTASDTSETGAAQAPGGDGRLSVDSLEARKQQILTTTEMDPALKDALVKVYDNILAEVKARAEQQKSAEENSTRAEAAPATIAEAKRKKENPPKYVTIPISTLDQPRQDGLQSLLQQQQSALQQVTDSKNAIEERIKSRETFKKDYARLITEQKDIQTKLNEELTAKPAAETDPQVTQARGLLTRAKLASSTERVRSLEQRLRMIEAEAELLPIQRDLLALDEANYQRQIKDIKEVLSKLRETYVTSFRDFARSKLAESPSPQDQAIAENMLKRAEEWLELTSANKSYQGEAKESEQELTNWENRFSSIRKSIDSNSSNGFSNLSSWVGLMLRRQRKELPDIYKLRDELSGYQARLQETGSLLLDLDDWIARNSAMQTDEADPNGLKAKERVMMNDFRLDADNFLFSLSNIAQRKENMIKLVYEYRGYIDQHVLWIRSTDPVKKSHFEELWPAFTWLFSISTWKDVATTLAAELYEHLFGTILFLIGWTFLTYNAVRLRRRIKDLGDLADRANNIRFTPTLRVLFITLLICLPWPGLMLFISYRLMLVPGGSVFVQQFGEGLFYAAQFFFFVEILRQVCRHSGLAEKHLEWPTSSTVLIRKNLRWFLDLATAFVLVGFMVLDDRNDQMWVNSLGRLSFGVLMGLFSILIAVVMNPKSGVLKDYIKQHNGGWVDRLRYIWFAIMLFAPIVLMAASLFGYHYTAVRLASLVFKTTVGLVGIFILYGLATRWLMLNRRQLAITQARQRLEEAQRESAIAAAGNTATNDVRSTEFRNEIRNEQKVMDMAAINAQTTSLVSACGVVAALACVLWIWADVLPAVSVLDSVNLWEIENNVQTTSTKVPGVVPGIDTAPDAVAAITQPKKYITLSNLLLAIPIAVLTVFASRNLPGLLEIALLQHLPIENAVRYAITTVSRYALLLIGIAITFNYVGMRWSSIQWLVAALGVGLGFGLQEIFANFVSGLILLFEQPIRVGDVISIGETTGAVAKIRMRATTITNWDRQELVVPNKDLITGRLLNWTLSDSTSRMVVTLNISFDSDPQRACEILLQLCREHPNVLNDPAASAFFESIADSGLQITLRFFLQTLDLRLQTRHDLLTSIYARFEAENIRVSRPQRELHVRSMPESVNEFLSSNSSDRAVG